MVEGAEYVVTVTLATTIVFSEIERDRSITEQDAINNARGTVRESLWDDLKYEGWDVAFEATRL